jgi:hypothetical protein
MTPARAYDPAALARVPSVPGTAAGREARAPLNVPAGAAAGASAGRGNEGSTRERPAGGS